MKLQVTQAQNFEGIRRARVFDGHAGCSVDVGAAHPDGASVTALFYQRGWRDIDIEPQPTYHDALCRERAEDVNLRTLVSNTRGQRPLYAIAPRA